MTEGADHNESNQNGIDEAALWLILVAEPLNKDADILVRWSRTSFFGGCPTSKPITIDGVDYVMFMKCNDDWLMKYTLSTALTNFKLVRLFNHGKEVSTEPYAKDAPPHVGGILGDAATMDHTGGMC